MAAGRQLGGRLILLPRESVGVPRRTGRSPPPRALGVKLRKSNYSTDSRNVYTARIARRRRLARFVSGGKSEGRAAGEISVISTDRA